MTAGGGQLPATGGSADAARLAEAEELLRRVEDDGVVAGLAIGERIRRFLGAGEIAAQSSPLVIWKFEIPSGSMDLLIEVPRSARFVWFAMQNGKLNAWAAVSPAAPPVPRHIMVVGTSHRFPRDYEYIGSCMDGSFVWHALVSPEAP